jgi:hypothetical protein
VHRSFCLTQRVGLARNILASLVSILCVAGAEAVPITFTETAIISGSLDGISFTDAGITITGVGDTNNRLHGQTCCYSIPLTATFTLAGFGSGTFTDLTRVVVNQNTLFSNFGEITGRSGAGFSDFTLNTIILWTEGDAFSTYDLLTDISITGAAVLGLLFPNTIPTFPTTLGPLQILTSDPTFTAVASEITTPLPAALPLFATGLGALGLLRWRKKKKAVAHTA